jgi:hypothetical protein
LQHLSHEYHPKHRLKHNRLGPTNLERHLIQHIAGPTTIEDFLLWWEKSSTNEKTYRKEKPKLPHALQVYKWVGCRISHLYFDFSNS